MQPFVSDHFEDTVQHVAQECGILGWPWTSEEHQEFHQCLMTMAEHDAFYAGPNIQSPRINLARMAKFLPSSANFRFYVNRLCHVWGAAEAREKRAEFIVKLVDTYAVLRVSYTENGKDRLKVFTQLHEQIWGDVE